MCLKYLSWTFKGGRRVYRQTENARKMVGKTEIIQKPAAAGSGNWSTASRKFYYYFLFSQVLHFLKDSIQYFAIFSSKHALFNIDKWISCVSIESNSKQTRVCQKKDILLFQFRNFGNRTKTRRKSGSWRKNWRKLGNSTPLPAPPPRIIYKCCNLNETRTRIGWRYSSKDQVLPPRPQC